MEESAFNALAEAELAHIEAELEACGAELDVEVMPGGILEIEFDNGSKMVINRHTAAREIWVAAKSGGFHFRPQDGRWIATRDGTELYALLSRVVSEQGGEAVTLRPPAA
ncbi:iron donor protein CyaY [Pseudothauera nasutitermitis]|uniref:Iron-sulfur cluster assembly protein CyaY n=1 Tax=Pseudothauera nasutitermitis TaxID=2565930 RepID=A0A4S4ASV8_9RHOO|nr:iron donor protein CyaY [Pseudothauera nasutitermitis]THF62963.1 iron donor protein CyaY [Pseudothauera nasutitermitis]